MPIRLSDRVQRIKPSATLAVADRAEKLKAAGGDIINLSVGEPDFDTPSPIKEAAIRAIQAGFTKYTAVDGVISLKEAIAVKFAQDNNLIYGLEQIIVSCGCKQAFFNLCQALLNEGDEVIIPAPYWVSYPDMVSLAGGIPVIVETKFEDNFKINAEQLASAITPKTRLVVINSPSNPSGIAYSKQELTDLGKVLLGYPELLIASDDMYEHILWNHKPFSNIVNACPELYERTVVLNGASKAYAMTGWRIGYAAGPASLIAAMKKIQSQSTSNPNSIAQIAVQAALQGNQQPVRDMAKAFKKRHDIVVEKLNSIEGIECLPADGTFYIFPRVIQAMAKLQLQSDLEFAEYLLKKTGVAVIPGSAFGTPGCIRLSFASSEEVLLDAMQRIKTIL